MTRKILFIINPHSGTSKHKVNKALVDKHFEGDDWEIEWLQTQYAGNAREIAEEAKDHTDIIVAIGGDGTVNEIASSIINSNTALGIIPRGSGNGLSRFLGLPIDEQGALEVIKKGNHRFIDTISLNDHCFVNMAGVGFDAHVAHLFKDFGARGFISYGKLVLGEFQRYPGVNLDLKMNGGGPKTTEAFVVSFANSSQYGNNAHIAPSASIDDGLMDVCVMEKFPLMSSAEITYRLFNKSLERSKYYHSYKVPEVSFESEYDLLAHVDGEPISIGKKGTLTVAPKSLKVVVP